MNIEIYDKDRIVEKEPIRLKLIKERDTVKVVAVNSNGCVKDCGHLIRFETNGTISLCSGINPSLGFDLDSNEQLKISK